MASIRRRLRESVSDAKRKGLILKHEGETAVSER